MNIAEAVSRHAKMLQWFTALSGFAAAIVWVAFGLALAPVDMATSNLLMAIFAGPVGGLISIHISWVAIWGVLGSGNVTRRVFHGLAIVHASFAVSSAIGYLAFKGLDGRELFVIAITQIAFLYATIWQTVLSMAVVWSMKYFRVRLVYADDATAFRTRQQTGDSSIESGIPVKHINPGSPHMKDLLALVALSAVCFWLWLPSVDGFGSQDERLFGAGFLFASTLYIFCANAGVGIVAVLVPMLVAMSGRMKIRTQLIILTALFFVTTTATTVGLWFSNSIDETLIYCSCFGTFVFYQAFLVRLIWKPSNQFRFRLIRGTI